MTRNLISFLCLTALLVFTACEKDEASSSSDGSGGQALTVTERLASNDWVITSYVVSPEEDCNGAMVSQLFPDCFDDCDIDDILNIYEDGTYTLSEGAVFCTPNSDEIYESGEWTMNSNEDLITFAIDSPFPYNYAIVSVTNQTITLEEAYEESGVDHTNTITYD
jgi:hypothetical protein